MVTGKMFRMALDKFLQKTLGPLSIKLYGGSQIEDLISGFAEPLSTGLENIFAFLKKI
jgi:hypothetical protein